MLVYSDAPIAREVQDGLSYHATFGASFPRSRRALRFATDVLGHDRDRRSLIVLLAPDTPIDSIACEAFVTA
ncbi:hypothetical protein [Sphingomonas kyeonggiensis]|uniref:Uncharacterized protein n=1 Tax=Sphingomonas kyeonggiensis TaxID=1268553 RepID=A0A7W6JSM3_9SPHN|nr:hypothetical protein [Sphingomonas kyeonggiensis]MBB4098849.1 hypothetical protein [Sphingomonas kyeonggiensis]